MDRKVWISGGVGLIAGAFLSAGLTYFILVAPEKDRSAQMAVRTEEAEGRLKKAVEEKEKSVRELQERIKIYDSQVESLRKERAAEVAAGTSAPAGAKPREKMDLMGVTEKAMKMHLKRRYEALCEQLGLTPEQRAQLDPLVDSADSMVKMEQKLKEILTPEQKGKYDAFQEQERNSHVEMAANAELFQMQTRLNLTEEQKDQVVQKIAEVMRDQMDPAKVMESMKGGGGGSDPTDILHRMMERKVGAMQGVLTPEQLEKYRKMLQDQEEMAREMMKGMNLEGLKK